MGVPVPLPTGQVATGAFDGFVNVQSRTDLPAAEKEEALKNIWRNASQEVRAKIEDAYPGSMEQYGAARRRRRGGKTKKSKKTSKKTLSRRR